MLVALAGSAAARGMLGLLAAFAISGCAKYYYGHPDKSFTGFELDSRACIREVGIPSDNGQYALVTRVPFQRCMMGRGWIREKKLEPVEWGWYRGVEDDEVLDLEAGIRQPQPAAAGNTEIFCRARHLDNRSDWRDRLPAYRECLGR
jgi:hypothetical protein